MPMTMQIPRTRGGVSGVVLVLLGIWAGLVAFVGPYFGYAYTPDATWTYTAGRLYLEILPAVGALVGGLLMLMSGDRISASAGGWLGAVSGGWLVVGNTLSPLFWFTPNPAGTPVGTDPIHLALVELGFFVGPGVVIVFFAALALGRFSVHGVKDAVVAENRRRLRELEQQVYEIDQGAGTGYPADQGVPAGYAGQGYAGAQGYQQPAHAEPPAQPEYTERPAAPSAPEQQAPPEYQAAPEYQAPSDTGGPGGSADATTQGVDAPRSDRPGDPSEPGSGEQR